MLKNIAVFCASLFFASAILIISIFRIAQIKYVFSQSPQKDDCKEASVNYALPYPGKITPDSLFWPAKALRDKVWLTVTINPAKKADIYLLLADKRLVNAKMLFDNAKADLGVSVLTKAEKYLEASQAEERIAHQSGMDTHEFLERYTMATLKHQEIINQILAAAPEDAKPLITQTQNYPKSLFNQARDGLFEAGLTVPPNPFN